MTVKLYNKREIILFRVNINKEEGNDSHDYFTAKVL